DRGDTAPGQHAGTTEGEGEQDTDSGDGAGTDGTADAGGDAEGEGVTWRGAAHAGPLPLSAFGAGDLEMRDLVICSLTEGSRFQGRTVAAAFGIQPSQVSRIRARYRE